ncbi:MAG: hypothetical protein R3E01_24870 [Pirellulaceae bacterium]|nr:hypothetical protein [Planctomycetales bacterium]
MPFDLSHVRFACCWPAIIALSLLICCAPKAARGASGELEIRTVDKESGDLIATRIQVTTPRGRPLRPSGVPVLADHFVCPGSMRLKLPTGHYTFEIERGPEYRIRMGQFDIEPGAADSKTFEMIRITEMRKKNWWSGDLHVQRRPDDMELLMKAEDLDVANLVTWSNAEQPPSISGSLLRQTDDNRFWHQLGGVDQRKGGPLRIMGLSQVLPVESTSSEYPSSLYWINGIYASSNNATSDAVEPSADGDDHPSCIVDAGQLNARDMPMWVASNHLDTVCLLDSNLRVGGDNKATIIGQPPDANLFPPPLGHGLWSQHIYYQLLEAGIRVPPSAASGSGSVPNPVGYNRVYVFIDGPFSFSAWCDGLRAGRVIVTNGPLLIPTVNDMLPGHVFRGYPNETVSLDIALTLHTRETIEYLEVIKNGVVHEHVKLDDWAKRGGKLQLVEFQSSGWLLIRAVTNNQESLRYVTTAPYYVEFPEAPRISRSACQFFLDWVYERAKTIEISDPQQRTSVWTDHRQARDFWRSRLQHANVD